MSDETDKIRALCDQGHIAAWRALDRVEQLEAENAELRRLEQEWWPRTHAAEERVAELEAENAELRGRVAALDVEHTYDEVDIADLRAALRNALAIIDDGMEQLEAEKGKP